MLPKQARIGMRPVVAVVLVVLPETHHRLDATQFLAIIMALFAFLTLWETIGGLLKGATLFEPWTERDPPEEPVDDTSS